MDSRERVLAALNHQVPDKIPFMFSIIDKSIREEILGETITYDYPDPVADFGSLGVLGQPSHIDSYEAIDARVARKLGLDAIGIQYFPPMYADCHKGANGKLQIIRGNLTSREALQQMILPDVDDDRLYDHARDFISRYKGEFALFCRVRLGISFIMNSMGVEDFSYAMVDDPEFLTDAIRTYTDWTGRLIKNLSELGFDFFWSFDDMAYKETTMFSNDTFREYFLPHLKKAASNFSTPWIFHSDGNLFPVLDSLLELGMSGLHPLEPGAMDEAKLKAEYGDKLCLVGNLDINHTLTDATREEVEEAVQSRIALMGAGGGYIISDSNSVPDYCTTRNVQWAAEAVHKYRNIY
ncbi:MAG: uroporphyrinogen decarboxylase family protein [Eubacteriales bacterium]|jgi:uroporphyrinogen decarboxylase